MSASPEDVTSSMPDLSTLDPNVDYSDPRQNPIGSAVFGALKGVIWDPIQGAWVMATHPIDTAKGIAHGAAQLATHPADTVAQAATNLYQGLTSSPESAGETVGSFIGPGDLVKGLKGLSGAEELAAPQIWAGKGAHGYDTEAATAAQLEKARGMSDAEIYDKTQNPALGGGMWNPPEQFGQDAPWQWVSDKEAALTPHAMDLVKDKAAGDTTALTMGDLISPDWKAFQAYPGLRDTPVHYSHDQPGYGVYKTGGPGAGSIVLSGIGKGQNEAELLDTLMHESAHAVQHFEGMPSGGSPGNIPLYQAGLHAALQDDDMDLAHKQVVRQLAETLKGTLQAPEGTADLVGPSMRGYLNIAGEANARLPGIVKKDAEISQTLGLPPRRPFELYGQANALPDPSQHLVVGNGSLIYHPDLPPRGSLGDYGVTGDFRPRGPDLAKALRRLPGGPPKPPASR